jgi:hypothetical protein
MKNTFTKFLASTMLLTALVFPLTAWAGPKAARPAPQPAPAGQRGRAGGERHPEIRAAIRALERAKRHLQEAAHDFGGHRAEALEAVNKALEQLKLALQYDKN